MDRRAFIAGGASALLGTTFLAGAQEKPKTCPAVSEPGRVWAMPRRGQVPEGMQTLDLRHEFQAIWDSERHTGLRFMRRSHPLGAIRVVMHDGIASRLRSSSARLWLYEPLSSSIALRIGLNMRLL